MKKWEELSNEELHPIAKENQEAFDYFYERNFNFIYSMAHKYKPKWMDIDEASSYCSIGLVKSFNNFKPEIGTKFTTYSSRIMMNELFMANRKLNKAFNNGYSIDSIDFVINRDESGNELKLIDTLTAPEEKISSEDKSLLEETLKEAFKNLNNRDKKIIHLRYFENKRQREIKEIVGLSQSYVSRIISSFDKNLESIGNKLQKI